MSDLAQKFDTKITELRSELGKGDFQLFKDYLSAYGAIDVQQNFEDKITELRSELGNREYELFKQYLSQQLVILQRVDAERYSSTIAPDSLLYR